MRLVAGSNALRRFKTDAFLSPNSVFLSCAVGCNLFEMNISYGFGNINAKPTAFGAVDRKPLPSVCRTKRGGKGMRRENCTGCKLIYSKNFATNFAL